jgi:hypothetical protein
MIPPVRTVSKALLGSKMIPSVRTVSKALLNSTDDIILDFRKAFDTVLTDGILDFIYHLSGLYRRLY